MLEPLLVAQLDAAEVEDAGAHRDLHALAATGVVRWYSAAQIAPNRWMPVPESPIWAPVTTGGPSSKPVVLIAPPVAWAMFS